MIDRLTPGQDTSRYTVVASTDGTIHVGAGGELAAVLISGIGADEKSHEALENIANRIQNHTDILEAEIRGLTMQQRGIIRDIFAERKQHVLEKKVAIWIQAPSRMHGPHPNTVI